MNLRLPISRTPEQRIAGTARPTASQQPQLQHTLTRPSCQTVIPVARPGLVSAKDCVSDLSIGNDYEEQEVHAATFVSR